MPWSVGLSFQYLSGTYGDYTSIGALLLDGGRLYLGGYFRTSDGRAGLAAVDAASGQPSSWRAQDPPAQVSTLTRLGRAVVATSIAFDVDTGVQLPWRPRPYGGIAGVAPAPEGAVIVGNFDGIDGEERSNLASIDLDTGAIEPWSVALPQWSFVDRLDTDGTFLFAITCEGRFHKIDPATGAVLGSLDFGTDVSLIRHRITNGRIIVAIGHSTAPEEVAAIPSRTRHGLEP